MCILHIIWHKFTNKIESIDISSQKICRIYRVTFAYGCVLLCFVVAASSVHSPWCHIFTNISQGSFTNIQAILCNVSLELCHEVKSLQLNSRSDTCRFNLWLPNLQMNCCDQCFTLFFFSQGSWTSYQIRKIACCACAWNAGNVFPATDFKGNH